LFWTPREYPWRNDWAMGCLDFLSGVPFVLEQPTDYFLTFEKYQFSVGFGVRDYASCGKFVQIASGNSRIVTGFLKSQYLFVRYQKFFQTVEPFENQKIVHCFPFLGSRNEQKRFCFLSILLLDKCMKIGEWRYKPTLILIHK